MQLHPTSVIPGALLGIAGIVLLWWALWKDRAKGRLRCPKCWYTLEGLPVIETAAEARRKCPECGHVARTPRSLQKTRRRWRWAFAAIGALLVGLQVVLAGTPGREGAWSFVPTLVLAVWTDDLDFNELSVQVLVTRIRSGVVFPWDRTAAGWIMLHRSRVDWEHVIDHRCRWPIGTPYLIQLNEPQYPWTARETGYIEVKWLDGETEPAYLRCFASGSGGCFFTGFPQVMTLPAPKAGTNIYNVCVTMEGDSGATRTHRMSLRVEGVSSEQEAMRPEGEWLTKYIRDRLVWRLLTDDDGVWAIVDAVHADELSKYRVNIAHRCELQRDGNSLDRKVGYAPEYDVFDQWRLESAVSALAGEYSQVPIADVVVVVSATPEVARQDLGSDRYWDGEIRVALRDIPLRDGGKLWDVSKVESVPMDEASRAEFVKALPEVRLDAMRLPSDEPAILSPTP